MAVQENLRPTHYEKTLQAMKAERTVKRIIFDRNEAKPGETLYVSVSKLNEHEVIVRESLFLVFDINLLGGHANNLLVQNVSRALVDKLVVKFAATTLQDTVGYDIYRIFEDLFLSQEKRENMLLEGIHSEDLCKIRSDAGDKKTSSVDAEKKTERRLQKQIPHPIGPPDPDRPRCLTPPGPLQRSYLRSNSRTCRSGCEGHRRQ